MRSRRQSSHNTFVMADSKTLEILHSLSDQAGAQPFSQCTVLYWTLFMVLSGFYGRETMMYSFIMVIMIFALIYAFHFATKYNLIDDLSGYADQNTLDENALMRERTYVLYPKPKELDLPHADNYTSTKYWDDSTKTRKKKEAARGEAELGSEDDVDVNFVEDLIARNAKAGGAGPLASENPRKKKEAERGEADLKLLYDIFPSDDGHKSKPKGVRPNARGKSPGAPKVHVPMCNKCGEKRLQGKKAKESGMCAKCTKKKK